MPLRTLLGNALSLCFVCLQEDGSAPEESSGGALKVSYGIVSASFESAILFLITFKELAVNKLLQISIRVYLCIHISIPDSQEIARKLAIREI
jgi:hypothetical protein